MLKHCETHWLLLSTIIACKLLGHRLSCVTMVGAHMMHTNTETTHNSKYILHSPPYINQKNQKGHYQASQSITHPTKHNQPSRCQNLLHVFSKNHHNTNPLSPGSSMSNCQIQPYRCVLLPLLVPVPSMACCLLRGYKFLSLLQVPVHVATIHKAHDKQAPTQIPSQRKLAIFHVWVHVFRQLRWGGER